MSGPASVGPPGSGLPPPPYPGFSPSHSPASASAPGSVGAPHLPPSPSPQFYPPKPSPSGPSLLASQLQHQSPNYVSAQEEQQRLKFQIELEFVQCLGNPNYLNFLAQRGYFKESTFINYLKYLQYWKEPQYVKFIKYPVCLHYLELLQHATFRKEIVNAQVSKIFNVSSGLFKVFSPCNFSAPNFWTTRPFSNGNIIQENDRNWLKMPWRRTRPAWREHQPLMLHHIKVAILKHHQVQNNIFLLIFRLYE